MNDPIPVIPARGPQVLYRAPREWSRMHPVSPLLGGWAVMAVALTIAAYNIAPSWTGVDPGVQEIAHVVTRSILWFIAGVLVIMALTVGFGYLQWRVNEFRLSDDAIQQRKGILVKQLKQARLDRLQAVDVVQPLLARIFGFAALKIEVAGGEGSGIVLQFLRLGEAEAIRNELLVLAAGVKRAKAEGADASLEAVTSRIADARAGTPVQGADALVEEDPAEPSAPAAAYATSGSLRDLAGMPAGVAEVSESAERRMYEVPLPRLIASILLSWATVWLVLVPVLLAVGIIIFGRVVQDFVFAAAGGSLVAMLPLLFGILGYFWSRLSGGFGFTAAISEDGIRLKHGLTETRRQTVPPGRVQAIRFEQSLLWRGKDWWRVTINVAGYQDNAEQVSTLLPVGTRQDALTALWLVLPDLGDPDPAGTVSLALSGAGDEGGFTPVPARARIFDPIQWRQRGVRATDRALLIRRGRLVREVFVVPHERTQSLGLSQGPWQKRRGLATFTVHSTNGPVKPVAEHLDVDDARALLEAQGRRAAEGRRHQTPEQWMSAVGISDAGTADGGTASAGASPGTDGGPRDAAVPGAGDDVVTGVGQARPPEGDPGAPREGSA
ncbi:PH domain-containing protein [Demequina sp. NBRC 110056]|uniref:PH domain-containing protein n=1 Tax=Demequina sp. NBRC 110056 TaxID=1570345 RepID=UPI001F3611D9|nr:PH domain-containing protein [Demequina sp. NBRC 110056]